MGGAGAGPGSAATRRLVFGAAMRIDLSGAYRPEADLHLLGVATTAFRVEPLLRAVAQRELIGRSRPWTSGLHRAPMR